MSDGAAAERAVVEVVDLLNGDRVIGLGFRLPGGAIAVPCRCLPRPAGRLVLPDPDHPEVLVLVRVREPGTGRVASGVVTAASPYAGLALLQAESAAGLTVPDELNPILPFTELVADGAPVSLGPPPADGAPALARAMGGGWAAATVRGPALVAGPGRAALAPPAIGSPVLDEAGRAFGMVTAVGAGGLEAGFCLLGEQLPGWALRAAGAPQT